MRKEKVILSFVAALVGILVAGIAFYFYQSTKEVSLPDIETMVEEEKDATPTPTLSPKDKDGLTITKPNDEAVVEDASITFTGKAPKDSIILVVSDTDSVLAVASSKGEFSADFQLAKGVNIIHFTAFLPDGKEKSIIRTVTYSIESF